RKHQLHASLALLPVDPGQVDYLYERMLDADRRPDELGILCEALLGEHHGEDLTRRLAAFLQDETNPDRRLRAACALTAYDPRNSLWTRDDNELSDEVANKLLEEPPHLAQDWVKLTRAHRYRIGSSFLRVASDPDRSESQRTTAAHWHIICQSGE